MDNFFENFDGMGYGTEDPQYISKALSTGYIVDPASMVDGGALRRESLQEELVMAVHEEESATFIKDVPKIRAKSVAEQYTVVTKVGQSQFYQEGGLPEIYADELKREFELVKFLGTVGRVTGVIEEVDNIQNAMAVETKLKTLSMVRTMDQKVFRADSGLNSLEPDGIWAQHLRKANAAGVTSQVIKDNHGKVYTIENANEDVKTIRNFYGYGELRTYMANNAKADMVDNLLATKRYIVNGNDIRISNELPSIKTPLGKGALPLNEDVFLNPEGPPPLNDASTAFIATSSKAPSLPIIDTTTTPAQDTFSATGSPNVLDAGTYKYAITFKNAYGESAAAETGNIGVTSGKKVLFTAHETAAVVGQEAQSVRIYRRDTTITSGITEYQFVVELPFAGTIQDTGEFIPGTSIVTTFNWLPEQVFCLAQLLPMMRVPLAKIDDSTRWLQKIYWTMLIKNARKIVVRRNVGNLPWS